MRAEGRLDGCACLGSGYSFLAEMAKCSRPMNFTNQYNSAIAGFWKGYLKQHAEPLGKHTKIDFAAAKRARSIQVQCALLACSHVMRSDEIK